KGFLFLYSLPRLRRGFAACAGCRRFNVGILMISRRTVLASCAAAAVLSVFNVSPNYAASGPDISHFKLDNGMEVVVIPDRRTPVVTHLVWYRVGSADEPPGKSGIAHFLEHLMFKGTEKNPAGRFSKVLATMGG